jgi:Tol biopolymer transport system component
VLLLRGGHAVLVVGATTQVTLDPGLEIDAAISPDGSLVAYAAGPPTRMQIYVRQVGGGRTVRLTDDTTMNHRWPRWSPDGSRVAYQTGDGTIAAVPALGGAGRVLVRLPRDSVPTGDLPPILGFDWSPDGQRLAYVRSGARTTTEVFVQNLGGGQPALVATVEQAHSPAWSPDGSRIVVATGNPFFVFGAKYFANEGQSSIAVIPISGGPPVTVAGQAADNVAPTWLPDGSGLLWVSGREGSRDVYRQAISRSGRPRGAPERVTSGLGALSLSLSRDGRHLAYATLRTTSNVWAVDIPRGTPVPGSAARPVTRGDQTVETAEISPDGKWLAFDSNRGGNYDIWRMPVAGGEPVQVTTNPANDFAPAWAPDGRSLSFQSMRNGNRDLFTIAVDGTDERQRTGSPAEELDSHWSPDGKSLVYEAVTRDLDVLRVLDLADGTTRDLWQGEYARWSPAGGEIAAIAPDGLRVGPAAGGASRLLVPRPDRNSGPYLCSWSADAQTLYYLYRDGAGWSIRSVPAGSGASRVLVRFGDGDVQPSRYAFTTDGRRFYFTAGQREADVWVAELKRR